jgi:hypothetical protein
MSWADNKKRVWYIEARPWSGTPGAPGYAPYDGSMGSGVVVELEELDETNRPFESPKFKKYLLTCGHVVRQPTNAGTLGWGPLLEEILCWPPDKGYSRTYPNKRRSGEYRSARKAAVSAKLSPHGGIIGEVPNEERLPQNDWVLLEIDDPQFQMMPSVQSWGKVEGEVPLKIVGFPGGAGFLAQKGTGHFWEDGDLVESVDPGSFQQKRTPAAGLLILDGPDETRQGMSGGGVFDSSEAFVGLHRSATDASMARGAIAAEQIRAWLSLRKRRPTVTMQPKLYAPITGPKPVDSKTIQRLVLGTDPKIPFINRSKLRVNLDALTRVDNRYKVLALTGQKGTGKSYTWHFIEHVAAEHGVIPVILDISQGQELDEACETIVEQMKLDVDRMRNEVLIDAPAKERVGKKFANWLARTTAARRPEKWWLALDGLDEADRPSQELDEHLVQWLIKGVRQNLNFTQVVLIMLGAEVPPDALLTPFVLDERLEKMTRTDITSFVDKYAESIGRSLNPNELEETTKAIAGELIGPFNGKQMLEIRKQAANIVETILI